MSRFLGGEDVWCPDCPPVVNKRGHRVDPPLTLVEHNYSGCGVDMGVCPQCGKGWEVQYKVADVLRAKPFDVDPKDLEQ